MTMLTSANLTGNQQQKHFKYKHHILSGSLEQYLHTLKKNSLGWQNRYSLDCALVVTMLTHFCASLSKLLSPRKVMQKRTMCQAWGSLRNFYKVPVAKFKSWSSNLRKFPFTDSWTEVFAFGSQTCCTDPDCHGTWKEGTSLLFVGSQGKS